MPSYRTEIEINVRKERIWNILTDLSHMTDWIPTHRDYSGPNADDIAVGTLYTHTVFRKRGQEGGYMSYKRSSEIISMEKGRSISTNTTEGLEGRFKTRQTHWTLQTEPDSTKVVVTFDYTMKMGFLGLILNKVFIGRMVRSSMKKNLRNLKQFAETGEKIARPQWMPK
jgi:carbon monoxide dehydrogenase subunit G